MVSVLKELQKATFTFTFNINDYLWHFTLLFNSSSCDAFLTLNAVSICKVHQRLASHGPRIVTGPQILVRALCKKILQLWKYAVIHLGTFVPIPFHRLSSLVKSSFSFLRFAVFKSVTDLVAR